MKLILGLAITSFGLLGCEQATPKTTVDGSIGHDISLSRAELIEPGMTRDEVLEVLGPAHNFMGRNSKDPDCEAFRNVADGEESFVQVVYRDQVVRAAYGGLSVPCLIL